jgi:hypothetical protein
LVIFHVQAWYFPHLSFQITISLSHFNIM